MTCRLPVHLLAAALLSASPVAAQTLPPGGLHIVVLAGEDAVNVIQQGSATAPIVQVLDANNQPVAGALVRFAVRSGRATFNGGVRTLSVATDSAGRAVALGYTPTSVGPMQLTATASFQGQTAATVTIAQTNAAVAAGAGVSGASAATGAAAAGAAGGATAATTGGAVAGAAGGGAAAGGGISAATIGIIGGAVGGGALVAKEVVTKVDEQRELRFQGPYSFQMNLSVSGKGVVGPPCSIAQSLQGVFKIRYTNIDGNISGNATVDGTVSATSSTCVPAPPFDTGGNGVNGPTTGNLSALSFDRTETVSGTLTRSMHWSFTGAQSGDTISGTLSYTQTDDGPSAIATGSRSVSVTLNPE